MPFAASGIFQRLYSWATDRDADIKILADRMDAEMNGFAQALTNLATGAQAFKGQVEMDSGLRLNGALTGTAAQADEDDMTVGRLMRVPGNGEKARAALRLGTGATGTRQTGLYDATPDRLMLVGGFGLGGDVLPIGNIGRTDGTIPTGLYAYATALGSSGGPSGVTAATLFHERRSTAGGEWQTLKVEASTNPAIPPGTVLRRRRGAGTWLDWLGDDKVAEGSSANGTWTRYADGRQVCRHLIDSAVVAWTTPSGTGTFISANDYDWTFPAAFSAVPWKVRGEVIRASAGEWKVNPISRTATGLVYRPSSSLSIPAGSPKLIELEAEGPW